MHPKAYYVGGEGRGGALNEPVAQLETFGRVVRKGKFPKTFTPQREEPCREKRGRGGRGDVGALYVRLRTMGAGGSWTRPPGSKEEAEDQEVAERAWGVGTCIAFVTLGRTPPEKEQYIALLK